MSPAKEKLLYFAQKSAPFANMGLLAMALLLVVATLAYRRSANEIQQQAALIQKEIGQVHLNLPRHNVDGNFDGLLKFVGDLNRYHGAPSYQQIIADLTAPQFNSLALNNLKVEYGADHIRLEMTGEIDAAFERAHAGYQGLLRRLDRLGYQIRESSFETNISRSQVMLKLTRPLS